MLSSALGSSNAHDLERRDQAAEIARENSNATLQYLSDLIRIPTINPPGDCDRGADRVKSELETIGLKVERYDVERANAPAVPIVLGWLGSSSSTPDLMLNAHVDAPPVGAGWSMDPYEALRKDGKIYGRGAALAKSDVAVYSYGVAAIVKLYKNNLKKSVVLAITADEGTGGSNGPRYLLEELHLRPKRVICPGITHAVITEHCGCVQAKIRIHSLSRHQALIEPNKEAMRTAVCLAQIIFDADKVLRRIDSDIPGISSPTLNITRIIGGESFGMAPGYIEIWLDRRTLPSESIKQVAIELQQLIEEFSESLEVTIDFELVQLVEPLRSSSEQKEWAQIVQSEAKIVLGHDISTGGLPLYTDARWFGSYGIPTIGYGAGSLDITEAGINGQDENVQEDDVVKATEVIARVIATVLQESKQSGS